MDWHAWLGEAGLSGITFPLAFTAKVAAISVVLHLFFGLLLGYYLSRGKGALRTVLDLFITLPLVFPPIALGFLLLLIMGKTGVVGSMIRSVFGVEIIFSLYGVVIAAFVAGLPLIVKPIQTAIQNTAANLIDASYTLGKSELETFIFVVVPTIKRSIAGGLSLALGRSLGEVGLTLMLGGNIIGKTNTLSLEIYNSVFTGEFERAGILAAILGCVSLFILFLLKRLSAI